LERHSGFCIAVDENVHNGIVEELKKAGFSIIIARECGLGGHTDTELLAWAIKEGCVLLTGDKDFGCLLEFGKTLLKGKVILMRYRTLNISQIAKQIISLVKEEMDILKGPGSLMIVLSEWQYRIHKYA